MTLKLDVKNGVVFLILCHKTENTGKQCANRPEKPAYKVEWNRFGGVTQYKWSGSGWTNL